MATFYEYHANPPEENGSWGSITIKTNDPELHKRICDTIDDIVDAIAYRRRIAQIIRRETDE